MTDQETGILDKVRKLLRLSTSSNANEAAMAAAKAQELVDKYQLEKAMVDLADEEGRPARAKGLDDEPIVKFDDSPLDRQGRKLDRWRSYLGIVIAKANGCQVWKSRGDLMVVGRPSDAETVRYLYAWLSREVERLATLHGRGKGINWRTNFRIGVVDTIKAKIEAQRHQLEMAARAAAGADRQGLMRVERALANVEARRETVEAWVKENMQLRYRSAKIVVDYGARAAGKQAGQGIELGGHRDRLTSAAKRIGG